MQLKIGSAVFDKSNIRSLQINQKSTLVVSELEPDAISAVVEDKSTVVQPLATSSVLLAAGGTIMASKLRDRAVDQYKYGEKITSTLDGVTTLMNVENIRRIATHLYQIDGISDIGLLMNGTYYGGIYNGITFGELVSDIVNGIFSYTVDTTLSAMPMYGWLPKSTRRDALHSVLFAAGAVIRKNSSGTVQIAAQTAQTPYTLENIYLGGTVEDIPPATKITVVEHSYFAMPTDEVVTLFDGEVAAEELVTPKGATVSGVIVEFTEPMHDLVINNGTIIESGANYAVLSQSPAAQLTGQRYTHTRRTLQHTLGGNGQPNEYTADECGLVNLMNAENVLSRLVAYYGATKQYPIDFVFNGQKPGDAVTFTDPFGDSATGYIESLDIVGSHTNKATARITEGYIPSASGNYYTNAVVFTADGTFTVPEECKGKIKVVLVGGGQGGHAGENGGDGTNPNAGNVAGEGGLGGNGGSGAKIYVATMPAKAGQSFSFTVGLGGEGAVLGEEPQNGGDTVLGSYSTANGFTAENGYSLLLLDEIIGLGGESGVRGGNGGSNGSGEDIEYNGVTYKGGIRPDARYQPEYGYSAPSGNGGGAAVGSNGGDGTQGYISTQNYDGQPIAYTTGGNGGNGADAIAREAATGIGRGGFGGHGGGGGGTGADGTSALGDGKGGTGGLGGQGGRGSDGAVIIYY